MQPQQVFTRLFSNSGAISPSREQLVAITEKYPYLSVAHFLLLQKTGKDHPDYQKTAGRTALHFGNPYMLRYKLDATNRAEKEIKAAKAEEKKEAVQPLPVPEPEQPVIALKPEKPVSKEELLFEPLFATDYFASQGIKLSEEVQPTDKLGKQLKSFTEWLKTMKKVHGAPIPTESAPVDMVVQKLAEKSNQEDEIITESMAEAYLQQGKTQKAREIFEKLSLFNPSKSAYFAAKIEGIPVRQS